MEREALQRACDIIGSQTALARVLGVRQGHIHYWLHRRGRVPAEYVLTIERETGVSRHELRPDVYPQEPTATSA